MKEHGVVEGFLNKEIVLRKPTDVKEEILADFNGGE